MIDGHVLLVEDAEDIRTLVRAVLERGGLRVSEAVDGRQALQRFYQSRPDLVVLDIGLPAMDGWEVLSRIREFSDVPLLMLTAHSAELEKVRGLRSGADDYVTKPFGRQELLARVQTLLRRARDRPEVPDVLDDGFLRVDVRPHQATANGRELSLTPLEFRLLTYLVRHPGQLLTHDQILEEVWGDQDGGGRDRLKLYIGYLRRKLQDVTGVVPIDTVRGMGYRYRSPLPEYSGRVTRRTPRRP